MLFYKDMRPSCGQDGLKHSHVRELDFKHRDAVTFAMPYLYTAHASPGDMHARTPASKYKLERIRSAVLPPARGEPLREATAVNTVSE